MSLSDEERWELIFNAQTDSTEDLHVETDDPIVLGAVRLLNEFGWYSDPVLTERSSVEIVRTVLGLD